MPTTAPGGTFFSNRAPWLCSEESVDRKIHHSNISTRITRRRQACTLAPLLIGFVNRITVMSHVSADELQARHHWQTLEVSPANLSNSKSWYTLLRCTRRVYALSSARPCRGEPLAPMPSYNASVCPTCEAMSRGVAPNDLD